ncbi:hypothetical protein, partial [Phocaeicola dorei]|uniref:hypothetical protein n=1 Tax=Phocaeicola dorei TaxID=357276 RepID=UPI0032EEFC27
FGKDSPTILLFILISRYEHLSHLISYMCSLESIYEICRRFNAPNMKNIRPNSEAFVASNCRLG